MHCNIVFAHILITVGLFANIVYIAIRTFSVEGYLATRSSSFLDFMTTALPCLLCLLALNTLAKPIARKRDPRGLRKRKRNYSTDPKSSKGTTFDNDHASTIGTFLQWVISSLPRSPAKTCAAAICIFVVTAIGLVEVSTIVDKLQNDHCPNELNGNDDLLTQGFQCIEWQVNMLLSSPACSCKYLYVDVWGCDEEDYNVTSFDDYLNPLVDHIEDTKFLALKYNPDCRGNDGAGANAAHSQFIASSLKELQMVSLNGDLGFVEFPQNVWSDLIGIHLYAPYLKQIDSKTLNSWSKLEVFNCSPCPSMNNENLFSQTSDKLPRLRSVNLEGVSTCPADRFDLEGLSSYRCTDSNETSADCNKLSGWLFDHLENKVRRTTTTECNQPSCPFFLNVFDMFDGGIYDEAQADALLDKDEFIAYLHYVGFPDTETVIADGAYACMVSSLRASAPFDQSLYNELEPSDGMSIHEFLASQSGASNCADCDRTQQLITAGAAAFEEQTFSECKGINYFVEPVEFQGACFPSNAACISACAAYIRYNQFFDEDHDGFLNETEYINARASADEDVPNGQFNCFLALGGSSCVDDSDGLTNLKMPLTNTISIDMWKDGVVELSSCADCFRVGNENEVAEENDVPCEDDTGFRDVHGDICADWQSSDCSDWFRELANDYTIFDLHQVESSCRLSCGFCEPPKNQNATEYDGICQDNTIFRDVHNNDCSYWKDHTCGDWEFWFGTYTFLELLQVKINCPVSCGICETPQDENRITCKDNFDFRDPGGKSCTHWQNFDCGDWKYHMSEEGYTRVEIQQIQLNCPLSCGFCEQMCEHTCLFVNNNVCDDGGLGSDYSRCDYGTDCNDCCRASGPDRAECTDAEKQQDWCADVFGFKDSQGYPCTGWLGYNCYDYAQGASWGYSEENYKEIQENCPVSCDICPLPENNIYNDVLRHFNETDECADVLGYTKNGHACSFFGNCLAEVWSTIGYSPEDMMEVTENCPRSCGFCPVNLEEHTRNKCSDFHNNCCAHENWGEPQTCFDDYVPIPLEHTRCPDHHCAYVFGDGVGCYGCFPPESANNGDPGECSDVPGFQDVAGHHCEAWRGFDCIDYSVFFFTKTKYKIMLDSQIILFETFYFMNDVHCPTCYHF